MSFNKQNKLAKKQGAFYELNLGKNNGPFLSKDIMYNNRKSMTLLTNKQILKSHQTMVETMKTLDKNKKDPSLLIQQKVENFSGIIDYCLDELKQFQIVSNSIRLDQGQLHKQLDQLNKKTTLSINQLYESSMPGIKLFLKKVKETNNSDKEQNYQLKRELERISQESNLLKKGLIQCQNKIESLQKLFSNNQVGSACSEDNNHTCY